MADRITRPQGLGLTFSPGRAVGSPYGNAGQGMAAAIKAIASSPDKTSVGLQKLGEGLKGLGAGFRQYKDDQQQAGLQRVLEGKDYNAPSVWDRITSTMGHVADGTLGQHANDRTAIRSTPMDRNPQNIIIGENGRLRYDPNAGNRSALDAEKLKQAQIDSARMKREEDAAANPRKPRKFIDGNEVTDPLPKKADGNNPTSEPDSTKLIPSTATNPNLNEKGPGSAGITSAGQVVVPEVAVPGVAPSTNTMTATASSPMAEPATATAGPGDFNYERGATDPIAINNAVTPGGDFNYNTASPLNPSSMLGAGDVYNSFDGGYDFGNGGLADNFGPAPFQFDAPDASYDSSQGLYAGGDYSSPMADVPSDTPNIDLPNVDNSGGMYG